MNKRQKPSTHGAVPCCRTAPRRGTVFTAALCTVALCAFGSRAYAQFSCSASINPTVLTPPTIGTGYLVGDVLTVNLEIGVGTIQGGTLINIPSVSHALDCIGPGTLIDLCVDETMKVAYLGDGFLSTDCGVAVSSNVPGGGAATNIMVFTFAPTAQLPAGTTCNVTFDVQILEEPSADATPRRIEEASGFNGVCNNGLVGQARGGLGIEVLFCGDNRVNRPEESCDGTAAGMVGCSAEDSGLPDACRDEAASDPCTCCGDGILQTGSGELCDDGNNDDHDGCDANCQPEVCAVQVDKQVSCDGINWFDVALVLNNEDRTLGPIPGCNANDPVYVRYQVSNVGDVDVENCTLSESSTVIQPGGTVQSGISIGFGVTLPETAPDSDQTCTDDLEAQEPNTATLHCDCVQPSLPPRTAEATDTATVTCEPICGDSIVGNTPGETCDPPGSAVGSPGETCRDNCTYCGDGVVDAGESCDDGNEVSGDGCDPSCQPEDCAVRVDKQVSCDGINWSDAGLVLNNEDGTNGPPSPCPEGAPVFVRYQAANVGEVPVTCTLLESSSVIDPDGTVQSGINIGPGVTLPETAPDSDQTCTDALEAQEPNTATLRCECVQPSLPPETVEARDTATVTCQGEEGDCLVIIDEEGIDNDFQSIEDLVEK